LISLPLLCFAESTTTPNYFINDDAVMRAYAMIQMTGGLGS
jgi:hypothetical protein